MTGTSRYWMKATAFVAVGWFGPFMICHGLLAILQPAVFRKSLGVWRESWPMETKLACLHAVPFLVVVALARPGFMSVPPRDPRYNRRCGVIGAGLFVSVLGTWINVDVWRRIWAQPVDPKEIWGQVEHSLWALGGAPLSVMTLFAEPVWALCSLPIAFGLGYVTGGIIRRRRRHRRAGLHGPGKPPPNHS